MNQNILDKKLKDFTFNNLMIVKSLHLKYCYK